MIKDELPIYITNWIDDYFDFFVKGQGQSEKEFYLMMIRNVCQIALGESDNPEHDRINRVGKFIIAHPDQCIDELLFKLSKASDEDG